LFQINPTAYAASPDDETFKFLASSYANHHAKMADPKTKKCDQNEETNFAKRGGITNGAEWYSVDGGERL